MDSRAMQSLWKANKIYYFNLKRKTDTTSGVAVVTFACEITPTKNPGVDHKTFRRWERLLARMLKRVSASCSCLCPIHWSQMLSREWRFSWSSADRRCSNYIWVINNFIAYYYCDVSYIRGLSVLETTYIYMCVINFQYHILIFTRF